MPERPDITVYLDAIERRVLGRAMWRVQLVSPFVLRSVEPPIADVGGKTVREMRRIGKRIVFALDDDLFLVIHLMIAGRFKWYDKTPKLSRRLALAAIEFESGTLVLTEAGTKRRASIYLVRGEEALRDFDRGGIEILDSSAADFIARLRSENQHTEAVARRSAAVPAELATRTRMRSSIVRNYRR